LGKERRWDQEAGISPYRLFCDRSRDVREGKTPRAPHPAGRVDSIRLSARWRYLRDWNRAVLPQVEGRVPAMPLPAGGREWGISGTI
jgi:hypothetical protein